MPRKTFSAAYKVLDEAKGEIQAIVSVFNNVDRAGERVLPGYFEKSLAAKLPKGVWMHDWTRPIAVTDDAKELLPGDPLLPERLKDLGGLYVKGRLNLDVQDGKDALSHLKFGSVDEFSFGYQNVKTAYDEKTGVRDLIEGEIFEWSPVLIGCNSATALLSAKDGRPLDPDDLLHLAADLVDRLSHKSLDDAQRAILAKRAAEIAKFAEAPAAAETFDSAPWLEHELRSLALRSERLLSTP